LRLCLHISSEPQYGGVPVNVLKRMKELEAENARLQRMFAELLHENSASRDDNAYPIAFEDYLPAT